MIKLRETIIVEGKYDKIKLSSFIDANIVTTEGFKIFNQSEKLNYIRRLAVECGVIIMTDPDRAGGKIRGFLKSSLPKEGVTHVFVPGLSGKEARKSEPSKEGLLGVEGIDTEKLKLILERFGINAEPGAADNVRRVITKADLAAAGFSGGENSAARRDELCKLLELPHLAANSLLGALNSLLGYEEFIEINEKLKKNGDGGRELGNAKEKF